MGTTKALFPGGQNIRARSAAEWAMTLVFKAVPADVCANCGETYVSEGVSRQILAAAEQAARSGVQVDVREFVGAVV